MNVVYAADEKFAEILAVSLESLYDSNKALDELNVYVLDDGLSSMSKGWLRQQAERYGRPLTFVGVKALDDCVGVEISFQKKLSRATFYRLFCTKLLPEHLERVLYVDCDTVVLDSLAELENFEMSGFCAAVDEPTAPMMKKKIELKPNDPYFNAGVMLIDLKKWRENNVTERFVAYLKEKNGNVSFEDQGVLNHVFLNQIDRLPMRYNVTTQWYAFGFNGFCMTKRDTVGYIENEAQKACENPAIVHFTNCYVMARPWVRLNEHPFAYKWQESKEKTPWAATPAWNDTRGVGKKICAGIYKILPGNLKYHFTYLVNGVLRPMLESLKG